VAVLVVLVLGVAAYWLAGDRGAESIGAVLSAAEVLGGTDTTGFTRALGPRPFDFPEDHGPHPEYRNEWWYVTGHLLTDEGRRFGYQFTIFRTALTPRPAPRSSSWATNQTYMGHFAVSDVGGGRFHAFERLHRGAQGLAGARVDPLRVWIEDWTIEGADPSVFALTLDASEGGVHIDLSLQQGKPMVLQGDRGWSRKGRDRGNASYYYSYTRMPTSGTLRIGSTSYDVSGSSWMDREWSTSALDEDVEGWDWFSLQLSDGRDIMLYRLRRHDGTASPFSAGRIVTADGDTKALSWDELSLEVLDVWESPRGGARYPSRWMLELRGDGSAFEIRPYLADQEWTHSVRYWEGAVEVRGSAGAEGVTGQGYVELTGYDPGEGRRDVGSARAES
jgi:predicted secreted hydrolase